MGAEDFHDFGTDLPSGEPPVKTSNVRAHVRPLSDVADTDELRASTRHVRPDRCSQGRIVSGLEPPPIDTTPCSSTRRCSEASSARQPRPLSCCGTAATTTVPSAWRGYASSTSPMCCRYRSPEPSQVCRHRRTSMISIDDIAEAVRLITPVDRDSSPVIVVNSDKDLEQHQESLDFDQRPVWRILVGGNKLARGFTIEGLTVSYYRRSTTQVDTLMQMGRWFGFRHKYRDLVRLYTTADLHAMFEAACLDEEYLRDQLRQYAAIGPDGRPQITPKQVPPLIAQHRPDLRPTSRTKMWNARIAERRAPGRWMNPSRTRMIQGA